MFGRVRRFWNDEGGQDLIEYSLLITFIAIACMWFLGAGRDPIQGIWNTSHGQIKAANAAVSGS